MKFKKVATGFAAVGLALSLAACSGGRGAPAESGSSGAVDNSGALIGVAMPTQTSTRWISDGEEVQAGLEEAGYQVDLQYANDSIPTQVQQVGNMITRGAKVLIIASVDGTALTDQLEQAASQGIRVIAYDRLINGSPNVDYYTTFDNYNVGVQQATSLLTGLGLLDESGEETDEAGPFNIEVFAGSPDDNNATFFFNGAMETLQPFIDDGRLVVGSGQTDFNQVATLRWDAATARSRMQNLIASTYSDGEQVDGVLSPYDGISIGIISALTGAGYDAAREGSQPLPIVTGQDAEVPSVKSIIANAQYSTIYKDTRQLAVQAAKMTDEILTGAEVEVNDTESYDNGEKVVPSYLFDSTIVTEENYAAELVDSGYYTEAELQ